jgi:hypothetical protein
MTIPKTMKRYILTSMDESLQGLTLQEDVPVPVPGPGQVLVKASTLETVNIIYIVFPFFIGLTRSAIVSIGSLTHLERSRCANSYQYLSKSSSGLYIRSISV